MVIRIIRKRSWSCPHCQKPVIAAEVEFPERKLGELQYSPEEGYSAEITKTGEMVNTLRILSERETIMILEQYIEQLEKQGAKEDG